MERDALTAPAGVLTIQRSKGSKRKDSRVDEEALVVWQDVLDMVVNGRPNEVACPHCNHRPLTIEEIDPAEAMTPERVRAIHKECLAEMEAKMGPDYWVYRG